MENLETRGVIKWAANCKVTGLVAADAATTKTAPRPKNLEQPQPKTHSKDICHQHKNHENELSATFSFKS